MTNKQNNTLQEDKKYVPFDTKVPDMSERL